jgi:hypothetical protein
MFLRLTPAYASALQNDLRKRGLVPTKQVLEAKHDRKVILAGNMRWFMARWRWLQHLFGSERSS